MSFLLNNILFFISNYSGIVFLFLGIIFMLISTFGMLKMPDLYTKFHSASVADTLAVACFIVGCICYTMLTFISIKIIILLVLVFFINPISSYCLGQAALYSGIKPTGKHVGGGK